MDCQTHVWFGPMGEHVTSRREVVASLHGADGADDADAVILLMMLTMLMMLLMMLMMLLLMLGANAISMTTVNEN